MTFLTAFVMVLFFAADAFAQSRSNVTVVLKDSSNDEAVGFATVSITKKGAETALKYALTGSDGKGTIEKIPAGTYTFKAEMMGYVTSSKEITLEGKDLDLGVYKLDPDKEVLDAASVSAVGNPIIVKKDTVEYNASSFKTTENDMLEDLLKKFPGVQVDADGSITANGEKITKIYVDGKTYFMDDPTLASKNLPAKIINKVKVVKKKSDQAEFTGIDDGEEETVLDLSVKKGMMNGLMGNLRAGAGHDLPKGESVLDDTRYSGNLFLGNFSSGKQYSVIGNVNNGNNIGFGGFGGQMMRGGGGFGNGGGITTSYMIGANAGYDLFDNKMETNGNYSFNGSKNDTKSNSITRQTSPENTYGLVTDNNNVSNSKSNSHNIGVRIEHNFSKKSSLIFEPQISFGNSNSNSIQKFAESIGTAQYTDLALSQDGFSSSLGDSKRVSASGRLQYRQRLGIPGRTLVLNGNFSYSNNDNDGFNQSLTNRYNSADEVLNSTNIINQRTSNKSNSTSLTARATYTEPLGNNFYVEGNYSLSWSRSKSDKYSWDSGAVDGFSVTNLIYNPVGEVLNDAYSNSILNENLTQQIGVNMLFQGEKLRAQVGASLNPQRLHNKTEKLVAPIDTTYSVLNWSPQARVDYDVNDNLNLRFNYRGRSSQPSVSQLIPVLDNSNPISQSLGNPYLKPSFSHNLSANFRYSNRQNFSSFNLSVSGGFSQNPIVNATWYDLKKTFSMPVNGPTSSNFNAFFFGNLPIAKSNFSVSTVTSVSTNKSSNFRADAIGTEKYYDGQEFDYLAFRTDFPDLNKSSLFFRNDTKSFNASEDLTLTYRNDALEVRGGGNVRWSKVDYSRSSATNQFTKDYGIEGSVTWSWDLTGLSFKSDINYRWYNGYREPRKSENILNAEISKLIFHKQATVSINIYDILGQTRSVRISNGEKYVRTESNTLGRYIMASFTWRFGSFGGGRGGARGGMGGGPMGPPPGGRGGRGPF